MSVIAPINEQAVCNGIGQNPAELDRLRDLYLVNQPERVLEIGVWFGGTLREWLENAAIGATVVAVDPEHQSPNKYAGWSRPDTTLVVGTGRSQDLHDLITEHAPYDWVFIDGDHTQEAVDHDVELTVPLVRKGGLLLLHDIVAEGYPPLPPRIAFDRLAEEHETWEIVEPTPVWYPSDCGHGIGVVQL